MNGVAVEERWIGSQWDEIAKGTTQIDEWWEGRGKGVFKTKRAQGEGDSHTKSYKWRCHAGRVALLSTRWGS